ncbi:hypothetical protein [Agromyces archimandritae]|uniref:Uncharacterized protein n=1 Tax=Agromyces archimandritae TaxID=2781962 RepID=A0A975FPE0_9MICO|nr:hypothetical protein [Agromyces archimandritae]QTX05387.1 hypothetical protein G127AT_03955 [Agromyces archimandritae]
MKPSSDEELDDRIRRLGLVSLTKEVQDLLDEQATSLQDPHVREDAERQLDGRGRKRGLKKRWHVGGAVALASLSVAVPAAGTALWLARTGEFGDPSRSTEEDSSEWIDLTAPDVPEVVDDSYPAYLDLPPGASPSDAVEDVQRIMGRLGVDAGGSGIAQDGLIVSTYEGWAICSWFDYWLDGDDAAKAVAVDWLGDVANYPAITALDSGGVVDGLHKSVSSARDGDSAAVERGYAFWDCYGVMGEEH